MNEFHGMKDLRGLKFGRLTPLNPVRHNGKAMWNCICDCGNYTVVDSWSLTHGRTKSCGCLWIESITKYSGEYSNIENIENAIKYTRNDGTYFIIDSEDYDAVSQINWYPRPTSARNRITWFGSSIHQYLHTFILSTHGIEVPNGYEVDHINRNPLDNRKCNLRIVTHQENMMNQSLMKNNKSGITGVRFKPQENKWYAALTYNKQRMFLGYYENKEDAIVARLSAEKKYYGDFAPQKHLFEEYNVL